MLTCVGHVPHGVFEGPDDGVQDQFELGRSDGQEGCEALGVGGLEEVEEMCSVFREFLKVLRRKNKMSVLKRSTGAEGEHQTTLFRSSSHLCLWHVYIK